MAFIMEESLEKWDIIPTENDFDINSDGNILDEGFNDNDDDLANVPIPSIKSGDGDKADFSKGSLKRARKLANSGPKNKSFKISTEKTFLTKDLQLAEQKEI